MKGLANGGHQHQHADQAVNHRRDPREQAHCAVERTLHALGRDLGKVYRRQKADGHAEDDRTRRAVYARENEGQDPVMRLCRRGLPHLPRQKRAKADLPDGRNAGNHEIDRDEQHAAHRDEAENEKHTVNDGFPYFFLLCHKSFPLYPVREAVFTASLQMLLC